MKRVFVGAMLVAVATAANAEEINYGYDALGRLIGVGRYAGSSDGYRDNLAFDNADNRSSYSAVDVRFGLNVGDSKYSPDGRTRLVMQGDGNLVIYFNGTALWSTGSNGSAATHAVMQSDGNFVLYTASNGVVWQSGTGGNVGNMLVMQNDGNAVVYDIRGTSLWASNTGGH